VEPITYLKLNKNIVPEIVETINDVMNTITGRPFSGTRFVRSSTPMRPPVLYALASPRKIVQTKHPTAISSAQVNVKRRKYLVKTFIMTINVVTDKKTAPIYNSK
jgi:hypothetical protein